MSNQGELKGVWYLTSIVTAICHGRFRNFKSKKTILLNSFFSLTARLSELLAGFVTIILAARFFGVEGFGEFAFIRAVCFILAPVITFGVFPILVREISVDRNQSLNFFCAGLVVNLIVGIPLCLILFIVPHFFYEAGIFPKSVFLVAIAAQLFEVMTKTASSVFIAYEKIQFDLINVIISRVLIILLIIAVVWFEMPGICMFYVFAVANLVAFIISVVIVNRLIRSVSHLNLSLIIYLVRQAFPIAIATFMTQGYNNIFVFLLKLLRDSAEVSFFQAPQRLIQPCLMIPRSLFLAYVPTLSRMAMDCHSLTLLSSVNCRILKYIFVFTLPVSLFVTAFAEQFIILAFGLDFVRATVALKILIWSINLLFVNILFDFVLTSMKKQNLLMISNALCLAASSSIGFVLVWRYGYQGACWATLLSYAVLVCSNFYFVSRDLGVIPVHRIVIKPLFASGVFAAILFLGLDEINGVILILICSVIYFTILFLLQAFTDEELGDLKKKL
ncbi:membrane hypothetical protein [Desulfamplus magnetovallimortis]|uniref:Uncharacterized protein n=1 Tax=Desulfamplus magnetovallimortis TaxID=1246637 RepID=A0A1W1HD81_9BACT|nr:flippase [Desulfamplus magnetovallimortis]SLM30396.1 membrane hypothetical protein [Desulfamplus magnetovallimortis]